MKTMIRTMSAIGIGAMLMASMSLAQASPEVGQPAPTFEMLDTNGSPVDLASLEGKTVVLEWTNHLCPYVRKHYESGNMQALQDEVISDDVVWISVLSSAPGKQGYLDAEGANQIISDKGAAPTHMLLDPSGELGHKYAAKTTPHMYIINATGELVYKGAIDSIPTADQTDIESAENYVRSALTEMKNGEEITTSSSRAFGCSVKYSS